MLASDTPDEFINNFLRWGMSFIHEKSIQKAMTEKLDPIKFLFNHFHLQNPFVFLVARPVFRTCWKQLHYYLSDAQHLFELFIVNPNNVEILSSNKGKRFLNKIVKRCYPYIYAYTFR